MYKHSSIFCLRSCKATKRLFSSIITDNLSSHTSLVNGVQDGDQGAKYPL